MDSSVSAQGSEFLTVGLFTKNISFCYYGQIPVEFIPCIRDAQPAGRIRSPNVISGPQSRIFYE